MDNFSDWSISRTSLEIHGSFSYISVNPLFFGTNKDPSCISKEFIWLQIGENQNHNDWHWFAWPWDWRSCSSGIQAASFILLHHPQHRTLVLMGTRWLLYFLVSHPCSRQEGGRKDKRHASPPTPFLKIRKTSFARSITRLNLPISHSPCGVTRSPLARRCLWKRGLCEWRWEANGVCSAEEIEQWSSHECIACVMAFVAQSEGGGDAIPILDRKSLHRFASPENVAEASQQRRDRAWTSSCLSPHIQPPWGRGWSHRRQPCY